MSQFNDIPLNELPKSSRPGSAAPSFAQNYPNHGSPARQSGFPPIPYSVPRNPNEPGFNYYKPRQSYKCYTMVLAGLVLAMMAGMIALGVELGKEKSHHHLSSPTTGTVNPPGTGMDAWNSTACSTSGGNCTALLTQTQVDDCFRLVENVCHAQYDTSHPIPQRNNSMFLDNPQCVHLIFQMYCQFDGTCKPMEPFCEDEFIAPPPPTPTINTSNMKPSTFTTTFTDFDLGATGTAMTTITYTGTTLVTAHAKLSPTPTTGPSKRAVITSGEPLWQILGLPSPKPHNTSTLSGKTTVRTLTEWGKGGTKTGWWPIYVETVTKIDLVPTGTGAATSAATDFAMK